METNNRIKESNSFRYTYIYIYIYPCMNVRSILCQSVGCLEFASCREIHAILKNENPQRSVMVLRRCLARSNFDTTALPSVVLWVVDFFALFHEVLYSCNFTPLDVVPDLSNSFQHSTRINKKVQALPIEGKPPSNLTSGNLGVFFRWWQQKLHCFIMKPVRQVLVISSFRPTRQTWR